MNKIQEKSREKVPTKSVVTIRMQNIMMQLRKYCKHPYLLEYPLTESEDLLCFVYKVGLET